MDNYFKSVLLVLLIVCGIGVVDTSYFTNQISEHKILKFYKDRSLMIGFGIEEKGNYVKVKDVIKGTPADRAGIMNRDVIISLNYHQIRNADKFIYLLSHSNSQEKLVLGILRPGESRILYVALSPQILRSSTF